MQQIPLSFFKRPETPPPQAQKRRPVEAVPHREKADTRTRRAIPTLLLARQLQDHIERLHGSMAAIDGTNDADDVFGDDMQELNVLIDELQERPDDPSLRANLKRIWDRRMPPPHLRRRNRLNT